MLAYENKAIPASMLNIKNLFPNNMELKENIMVEAVFSWRWYAQVLDMKIKYGPFNVHCLKSPIAPPILGSWALGILDGSLNIRRALATIRLLLSDTSQREMEKNHAAISVYPKYWDSVWFTKKEQSLLFESLDRTKIKNYTKCSQLIADVVNEFLHPIVEAIEKKGFLESKTPKLSDIKDKLETLDNNIKILINS